MTIEVDIGNLYVIVAPSGTGKTSLVKALVDSTANITVSISHTTRLKRPGEVDGVNYYFVDIAEFKQMIAREEFLEHAVIFENLYGTSKKWVDETLAAGLDVILEIDWQGNRQIKSLFPQAISIFIAPPSPAALYERLMKRNQDAPHIIQKRLADAPLVVKEIENIKKEMVHVIDFNYLVINNDFTQALEQLKIIVMANRLLLARQHQAMLRLLQEFKLLS